MTRASRSAISTGSIPTWLATHGNATAWPAKAATTPNLRDIVAAREVVGDDWDGSIPEGAGFRTYI